ncbi:F-box protein At5g65850-like isoform X2 [Tripterygium wilfordii]|uniref:F-box protein At5g65850-like isoform X2 n=1 Tax=Tripterygium wilfordii TaxID=458696 RepID=UPI0018F84BB3|nr:F-box protein At5g65850-like isoform X2 [Tripterygium wilfordii]
MAEKMIIGGENHRCDQEISKSESESREWTLFLPVDMVINILSRLSVELLPSCRRVCKCCERRIAGFANSYVRLVSNYLGYGLFLFKNNSCVEEAFLYNPIKGEVLMLPRATSTSTSYTPTMLDTIRKSYGLGFDSTTNQYKLVYVCDVGKWKGTHMDISLVTKVLTLGSSEWRQISDVPPCCIGKDSVAVPASEVIHWKPLKSKGMIVSFDVRKEKFRVTPLPHSLLRQYELFSWRETLALTDVSSSTDHLEIWVLKDYDNERWAKEYRISTYRSWRDSPPFCGAWEDGMIFIYANEFYYYDLKTDGVTPMYQPRWCSYRWDGKMMSYSINLQLSLKNYGDLVKNSATQSQEGDYFDLGRSTR